MRIQDNVFEYGSLSANLQKTYIYKEACRHLKQEESELPLPHLRSCCRLQAY